MTTAATRMSIMTGRAAFRAPCIARSVCNTPAKSTPRRFLTTSTPCKAGAEGETMDWNTYFALRRSRRNYEYAFMAPCALIGLAGTGYYFAQKDFDPTPIFGMDQVVVYIAGTIAGGIVGLAAGPMVGNMIFRAVNSKSKPLVDRMDKEFFKHIVKNRADPSTNSLSAPIPDFYGEKIKSVSEYRSWLRKQREYRRKTQFFVGTE
ncbi:TIM23 complex component [Entomortierella chlamydospora]|uniref:Presequence translocated-associated motor subunit PAM17 n=1 Tax=Entomortierella chlamydospora TaxID=101097 RepID=A0A9P6SY22_9FUNG|nr:TIM23 complex component [Entomortierella chlamydospora]KAG0010641.1 TIM23 complex component [Entomortierella chlamydospora]